MHLIKDVGKKHDEHEGMLRGHSTGHLRETWPNTACIEGMVQHEPLVWNHHDPELLLLAGANAHHVTMFAERKVSGLAVWPKMMHPREIEMANPIMVNTIFGKGGVKSMVITDVHDEVEEMWTTGGDDVGL